MSIWFKEPTLAEINAIGKNSMVEYLDIEFMEIGSDFLVARMPVDHRTIQPFGILHGGASCVLAETIGSMAANFCVDYEKCHCVGLDINTNHIRSVTSGHVVGIAKPFHLGKTTQVWSIEITGKHNKLVSVTRLTMVVLKKTHGLSKSD